MTIKFRCWCGHSQIYYLPDHMAGKVVRCPFSRSFIKVPEPKPNDEVQSSIYPSEEDFSRCGFPCPRE